jgi:hypothetical protein
LIDRFRQELAAREFKLKPTQVRKLLVNAAQAAFGQPSLRNNLAAEVENSFV